MMNSTCEDRKDDNDTTYEIGEPTGVFSFEFCAALSLLSHVCM